MAFKGVFHDKRVLVTGHTGFKGAWLTAWLSRLGAEVHGLSLPPESDDWLFASANLGEICQHNEGDIRDLELVRQTVREVRPDLVFHLAAQALVRASYRDPVATVATNIMGTVHVLEALRGLDHPVAAVMVTSDKCYENREWPYAYRENDAMGGHDVYSMSKGGAELAVASYRRAFFPHGGAVAVASARAGNVIGPGDWAEDRIVPDAMRTLLSGQALVLRNPNATRPWQHVLEPLSGYLWLGARLVEPNTDWARDGWNFGPAAEGARTVAELTSEMIKSLGQGTWINDARGDHPHEANFLRLSIEKATSLLGWRPVWGFEATVQRTVQGYQKLLAAKMNPARQREMLRDEIDAYTAAAAAGGLGWASD